MHVPRNYQIIEHSGFKAAEQILWLSRDKIEDAMQDTSAHHLGGRDKAGALPELVGSGESAGGVVSQVVGGGGTDANSQPQAGGGLPIVFMHSQLQRIVSKCKCEFYYVAYGDNPIDQIVPVDKIPKQPEPESPWSTERVRPLINSFSLVHHDLNVCTNSLQYSMILGIELH